MSTQLRRPEPRRSPPPSGDSWYDTAEFSRSAGRVVNMDALGHAVAPSGIGLWVVADGLGGHPRSEAASSLAVKTILAHFRAAPAFGRDAITALFEAANTAVLNVRASDPTLAEIATTLVVLLSDGTHAIWGHVGDSRLYVCGGGEVTLATVDHRNASRELVRALPAPDLVPELNSGQLHHGDALLLCVDGVWEALLDLEIAVDYAKSKSAADWLRYLDWRVRGRRADNGDSVSALAVRMLHPELQKAETTLPLPPPKRAGKGRSTWRLATKETTPSLPPPKPAGKGGSTWRLAMKLSAFGLLAGLLIAFVLGIFEVKRRFEIKALVASIEEQGRLAESQADKARQAAANAKSDAEEALDAQKHGRTDEATSEVPSADEHVMTAAHAAVEARQAAARATDDLKELTDNSGSSEQARLKANAANDRAKAAAGSARDAIAAAAAARDAAATALVDDAKRQANAARNAASNAKKAAAEARTAMNSVRSQEAEANVKRAGLRATDAEGAARMAQGTATAALDAYSRLMSSQSWLSLLKPNGIEDAKEAANRARNDAKEADDSAKAARADADLAMFRNWAMVAAEQARIAEAQVVKARTAVQDAKTALTAAQTAAHRASRQQAKEQVDLAEQHAGEAGRAAAVALEEAQAARRRMIDLSQSRSNPQAAEAPLRQAKDAEDKAQLATNQAQAAVTQAEDLATQAKDLVNQPLSLPRLQRRQGLSDAPSGPAGSGNNELRGQSGPTGNKTRETEGAAGDSPAQGTSTTPDTDRTDPTTTVAPE